MPRFVFYGTADTVNAKRRVEEPIFRSCFIGVFQSEKAVFRRNRIFRFDLAGTTSSLVSPVTSVNISM